MNSTLIVIVLTILAVLNLMILISVLYTCKKNKNVATKVGLSVLVCTLVGNLIYIVGGLF